MEKLTKDVQKQFKQNEKKWTKILMEAGWTVLPSVILDRQRAFGLDAVDINILLHLAKHWWYADNLPRPSKQSIADCMNIDKSTVRRHIASMEKAGLIKRTPRYDKQRGGQQPNTYDFEGLIKEATPFAEESIRDRETQKKESAIRRTRKRPIIPQDKEEE